MPFGENGQQAQAQVLAPDAWTVAVLTADWPLPVTVPGSPEPVSFAVSCHGAGPSSKPLSAVAATEIGPAATQTVWLELLVAACPATETEHQLK